MIPEIVRTTVLVTLEYGDVGVDVVDVPAVTGVLGAVAIVVIGGVQVRRMKDSHSHFGVVIGTPILCGQLCNQNESERVHRSPTHGSQCNSCPRQVELCISIEH